MDYSKTVWINGTTPAINAVNLNNIEQGLEDTSLSLKEVTLNITTDANYELTALENKYGRVVIPSGILTATRLISLNTSARPIIVVNNASTAQTIQTTDVGTVSVDVPALSTYLLYSDGVTLTASFIIDAYAKAEVDAIVALTLHKDNTDEIKIGSLTIGESIGVTAWSFVTTTITLTVASHNAKVGDTIYVSGLLSTTNPANGTYTVTSVTATTIVYTALEPTGTPTVSSATVEYGDIIVRDKNLSKVYASDELTLVNAGNIILTHGLGSTPESISTYLVCKVAEHGYSIGDILLVSSTQESSSVNDGYGISITISPTQLDIRQGNAITSWVILNKTTGVGTNITGANWKLKIKAKL